MNNYSSWNISAWDYPKEGNLQEKIKYFSKFGILAASIHNTQPWIFEIIENKLKVTPNLDLRLTQADPIRKNLFISLGCCIKNIECVAAYHNYVVDVSNTEMQKGYVEIEFTNGKVSKTLAQLAPLIPKRFSNKFPYDPLRVIEKDKLKKLRQVYGKMTKIYFSEDREAIHEIAEMQKLAVIKQTSDKKFITELASWLRKNDTKESDGMPGFTVGLTPPQTAIGKILMPRLRVFTKILASKDEKVINSSPLIGIIINKGEKVSEWIETGMVYQELALTCFSAGVFITPHHSIAEDKTYSKKLTELLGVKSESPQMFFRLGYNDVSPYHTPRRQIDDSYNSEFELARVVDEKIKTNRLEIRGFDINYVKVGSGAPILLIHGGNIGWGQWYPNIHELSKKFTVYAIDLPGGGRSTKVNFEEIDFESDLVNIVVEFIKKLKLKRLHLVGSSAGGWVAAKIASNHSELVNKLVLVDSVGFSLYQSIPDKILSIKSISRFVSKTVMKAEKDNPMIETLIRSVFNNPNLHLRREFLNYFYDTMIESHNLLFISRMARDVKKLYLINDLSKIKSKTLIIWGEKDKLMPLKSNESNFSLIKNSKTHILKDAGHICSIERSEEFNTVVKEFLK